VKNKQFQRFNITHFTKNQRCERKRQLIADENKYEPDIERFELQVH
jgi:hypothetical protein